MRSLLFLFLPVLLFAQSSAAPRERVPEVRTAAEASGGKSDSGEISPSSDAGQPVDKKPPGENSPDPIVRYTLLLVIVGALQFFALIVQAIFLRLAFNETTKATNLTAQALAEAQRSNTANEKFTAESNATARISADAAKASADAFMDGQRGWILIHKVEAPHVSLPAPHCAERLDFEVVLKVSGNSPCKIIDAGLRFHLQRKKENVVPPEPDLPESPDYTGNWKGTNIQTRDIPHAGVVFEPETEVRVSVTLEDSFTSAEYEAVNEGWSFLCAYGFVLYVDAFERDHETRFCFIRGPEKIPSNISRRTAVSLYLSEFDPGGPAEYNRTT